MLWYLCLIPFGKAYRNRGPCRPVGRCSLGLDLPQPCRGSRSLQLRQGILHHRNGTLAFRDADKQLGLPLELGAEQVPGNDNPDTGISSTRLGTMKPGIIETGRTTGEDDLPIGIELDKRGPDIVEPAQGLKANRSRVSNDDQTGGA